MTAYFAAFAFVVVLALLPAVAARRNIGGVDVDSSNFVAPPVETANLVAYSLFLLAGLIQLMCALPALFRPVSRLPAVGVAIALTFLIIGNALGAAYTVIVFTIDDEGNQRFSGIPFLRLFDAFGLFYQWTDPAIFTAVALVLYHRYRTVQKSSSAALIAFMSAAGVLLVLTIALISAENGMYSVVHTAELHDTISFDEAQKRYEAGNKVFYAYTASHILGSLLLTFAAFLVKARTKKDTVVLMTFFVIIPSLLLHALTRLIFSILQDRLPYSEFYTIDVGYALDFASTLVYGLLYLAAMSVLVFLLGRTRMWEAKPPSAPVVGVVPLAQFPGQWGDPQQFASQMYAYVPVQRAPDSAGVVPVQLPVINEKIQASSHEPPAAQA